MENFKAVVDKWLDCGAAIQVQDRIALKEAISRLLADPKLCETMSERACQAVAQHQGATKCTAKLLVSAQN